MPEQTSFEARRQKGAELLRMRSFVPAARFSRPSFANHDDQATKQTERAVEAVSSTKRLFSTRPRQKIRKRNAGRRIGSCPHASGVRDAPRKGGLRRPPLAGALACRRSTAALRGANQRPRSAPGALPGTWLKRGRYPPPPVPVQRHCRRPVMLPAGRFPEAARERSVSFRPRAPHSLRRRGVPSLSAPFRERDSVTILTETGTQVNGNVTHPAASSFAHL
jgi:hypothetical protein